MAEENQEQIEYWNDEAGEKWVTFQEDLDTQLSHLMGLLFDAAALAPGERVLDVGCGCGATSLAAAEAVGASGAVTGVDISVPMLAHARKRAEAAGVSNVEFIEADAADHVWGDVPYDVAISRFGVMFFADPAKAFANIRKALRPGGRVAFLAWQSLQENEWMLRPLTAVAHLVELPAPPDPHAPGPFALADGDRTRSLLEAAGFSDVKLDGPTLRLPIGATNDVEGAVDFIINAVGPLARILKEQPDEKRDEVEQALRESLAPGVGDDGVKFIFAPWVITATNP